MTQHEARITRHFETVADLNAAAYTIWMERGSDGPITGPLLRRIARLHRDCRRAAAEDGGGKVSGEVVER